MIGYQRNAILKATDLVDKLRQEPFDKTHLKDLQNLVINKLISCEQKIQEHRARRGKLKRYLREQSISKNDAAAIRVKINFSIRREYGYKSLLYIWRCFGDAVVFIYYERTGIRPYMYGHADNAPKPLPGPLSKSKGFQLERRLTNFVIERGAQAILCDVTNIIRHGDICFLGLDDPRVIEVKTSKNQGSRSLRQARSIEAINEYLDTDQTNCLLGLSPIARYNIDHKDQNHSDKIPEFLDRGRRVGFSHLNPETGIKYFYITRNDEAELSRHLNLESESIVFILNEAKDSKAWELYIPFTLSLRPPEALYSFIAEDFILAVVIEIAELKKVAHNRGYIFSLTDDESFPYRLEKDECEGGYPVSIGISGPSFNRLAFDFLSFNTLLDHFSHISEKFQDSADLGQ